MDEDLLRKGEKGAKRINYEKYNYACNRHHLDYLVAEYHDKSQCKISIGERFLSKDEKITKMHKFYLIILINPP